MTEYSVKMGRRFGVDKNKQNLTEGSLGKKILWFSVPLMLSNVLQILFNMADIAVVGQFAGSLALGSVGSTTILVALFTGILIGMASGINVLAAMYLGAQNKKGVEETVHSAAIISLLTGLFLLLIGVVFSPVVLGLMNTKAELIDGAVLYVRIYFLGMPALALYNFGNAVFSAAGDTKRPLFYLAFSGGVNIVLNLFFVIACGMDVAGVALASIISQYISAILILTALVRSQEIYSLRVKKLQLNRDKAADILRLGVPSGLQNAIFQIANLFIQTGVNSFDAIMVAGNAAASNADGLVFDIMAAFYTACGSFMGQNYGAGKKNRILKSYFISLSYALGIGAIMGLLLVCFGREFVSLFTNEAAVIAAGYRKLVIIACSYWISSFMDCTIAASRALGKTVLPTVFVIMGSCVFRIIWVNTVFAHFRTIPSLYLLYPFSWAITGIAEIVYFRRVYKEAMTHLA